MRPKAASSPGRRSGQTPKRRVTSSEADVGKELGSEVERPLDAEDVALASLEAQVRAKEARADLGSIGQDAVVAIRLSGAVMARLEAEATKCRITPSELIKQALMQYLR